MIAKKGESKKSLLMTIALTGAAVCYVAFIFMPGQRAIAKLREELDERQQAVVEQRPALLPGLGASGVIEGGVPAFCVEIKTHFNSLRQN